MVAVKVTDKNMSDLLKPDGRLPEPNLCALPTIDKKKLVVHIDNLRTGILLQGRQRSTTTQYGHFKCHAREFMMWFIQKKKGGMPPFGMSW